MSNLHDILSPFDRSLVGQVEMSSAEEVAQAIDLAAKSFSAWSARPVGERSALLEKAAHLLMGQQHRLAQLLARESGKILRQAEFEILFASELLRGNADRAKQMAGHLLPTESLGQTATDLAWMRRVPLGTIAAILPFNFPVELLIEKVAAALAAGNTVVVKPPEQNPLAVLQAIDCFYEAGIPREVLQVAVGGAEVGAQLASSPKIAAISLTGSTRAGLAAAQGAAPALRRLHLELGGNDAALILEDADLDLVVSEVVPGRILMNGQSCAANKRIVVHRSLLPELTERIREKISHLKVGDPLDYESNLGPLISEAAARRVIGQIQLAIKEGARLVHGKVESKGALVAPHLLTDVPVTAQIASDDEIFGPVFTLIPVASDREALQVANQSSFGLNGSVFSRDTARALALSEKMEVGGVVINGSGNYRPPFVPFGGVKLSGMGREGLGFTLEDMTQPKFTVLRRFRRPDLFN